MLNPTSSDEPDPATTSRSRRFILAALIAVLAISAGVRIAALDLYPGQVFDEHYYVMDARAYLGGQIGPHGERPSWWPFPANAQIAEIARTKGVPADAWWPGMALAVAHPYGAELAIATGLAIVGDDAWGARLPSAIAGTLLIALVYPLARRLRLSRLWALAATILAAADTLLIVESRLAVLDIFVALWTALSIYCALRAAQSRRSLVWVAATGVALGLAVACKWSGALALPAVVVILLLPWRRRSGGWWLAAAALLVALPFAAYLATWLPYFSAGHTLGQWATLQHSMWHDGLRAPTTPGVASRAPTWILDIQPVWMQLKWSLETRQAAGLVALGNPLLWWGSVAASVVLIVQAVRRRRARLALPVLIAAALYLPWFAVSRIGYLYYLAPVVPFLAVIVAAALSHIVGDLPAAQCRRKALAFAGGLLLICGGWGLAGLGDGAGGTDGGAIIRGMALLAAAALLSATLLRAAHATPRRPEMASTLSWAYIGAVSGFTVAFLPFLYGYSVAVSYLTHLKWLPWWL